MKTCFPLPPRIIRPTLRCALQDDSVTRLREMQRVVQARRTDLRARGIRGKADEEDVRLARILDAVAEPEPVDASRKKVAKRERPRQQVIFEAQDPTTGTDREVGRPLRGRVIHRVDGALPFCRREEPLGSTIRECELESMLGFTKDTFAREDGTLPWKRVLASKEPSEANQKQILEDPEEAKGTILEALNEAQQRAVLVDPSSACLVLAGPGSGKTRVLTHRIAYLVKKCQISPYKILAVTFSNKPAREMSERVVKLLVGDQGEEIVKQVARKLAVGTFHSISARFLRKYGEEIGIPREYDICDVSDSRSVLTKVMKEAEHVQAVEPGTVGFAMRMISKIKNMTEEERQKMKPHTYKRFSDLRDRYDAALRSMKLLDYDDLLLEARRLLEECPHVLQELQGRFDNVLVDEWQDTNNVQFDIVSLLAGKRGNLFVVGDADQSIYKFRGADSGNIQRFCAKYPDAVNITLEQNYRSSGCIVEAAQSVINVDKKRPNKHMITTNDFGSKVVVQQTPDCRGEARFVVTQLRRLLTSGELERFSDAAVLYRTNAQSRQLEEAFLYADIPYKLHSGVRFYERAEIKDIVAYVRLIANPDDDNSFRRIVNTPPRGMGKRSLEAVEAVAEKENISLSKAVTRMIKNYQDTDETSLRPQTLRSLANLYNLLYNFRKRARPLSPEGAAALEADSQNSDGLLRHVGDLVAFIIEEINYRDFLDNRKENEHGSAEKILQRHANVDELIKSASRYKDVREFLENVALLSNTDQEDQSSGRGAVSLMTLHSGKGLEFKAVFIVGAEDGVIPTVRNVENYEENIDEERRLLYVGMTRAMDLLYITWRTSKLMVTKKGLMRNPSTATPSRFLGAIPEGLSVRMSTCGLNST